VIPPVAGCCWPNITDDCGVIFGPGEVDFCVVVGVCCCLVNCAVVCSPSSMKVAQKTKTTSCSGHVKNAKKSKKNPDNDDMSPPSLTKGALCWAW